MAIVAIMFMPDSFPQNDFVRELIFMSAFGDGGVSIDGEPDENSSADGRPPEEEIPSRPLLHRSLLDKIHRTRVLNLECLERG